ARHQHLGDEDALGGARGIQAAPDAVGQAAVVDVEGLGYLPETNAGRAKGQDGRFDTPATHVELQVPNVPPWRNEGHRTRGSASDASRPNTLLRVFSDRARLPMVRYR